MRRILPLAVLCVLPSVGFAQTPGVYAPGPPDLSGGKWSGYWISDKNGHNGPLNATFKLKDCNTYEVKFSGRFAKVIPFRYKTTMDIVGGGDGVVMLAAEKRLGPFGQFRMTAVATGTDFDATFTSPRDSGRFVLRR
jgi:hypothetical protein